MGAYKILGRPVQKLFLQPPGIPQAEPLGKGVFYWGVVDAVKVPLPLH